jgi:SAM-dependent methyltransferase
MGWSWVRPADPTLLGARPLLDLGTGDAQTLRGLVAAHGLVVGVDRSEEALRSARGAPACLVAAIGDRLPFGGSSFGVVLAGDLFHHLDDEALGAVLAEAHRVLRAGGRLVAWWYEHPGRPSPDAPRFPRAQDVVTTAAGRAGFDKAEPLALEFSLEPAPATVGIVAARR